MKLSRRISAAAGASLLVAGVVLSGGAATAAIVPVTVLASDFAANPAQAAPGWGYRNGPAPTSGPTGLSTYAGTELHLGTGTSAYGQSFQEFTNHLVFDQSTYYLPTRVVIGMYSNAAAATGYFEVTEETTTEWADSVWTAPWGDHLSVADVDAYLGDEFGPEWGINGVEIGITSGPPLIMQTMSVNDVHYDFTPVITQSITPAVVTPAMLATTGVTATFVGYVPGQPVGSFLITGDIDDPTSVVRLDGQATVDSDGIVTVRYIAPDETTPLGVYSLVANTSRDSYAVAFSVVAALPDPPVTPTAPTAIATATALAATGQDSSTPVLASVLLLLTGAWILVARRRNARLG